MPNYRPDLPALFRALGDPTRLAVVERLSRGPAPVGALAARFDMALPSFTQHLALLEEAGLVRSRKNGRTRTCALAPGALKPAQDWLARRRELWERRLDRLDDYLLRLKEGK